MARTLCKAEPPPRNNIHEPADIRSTLNNYKRLGSGLAQNYHTVSSSAGRNKLEFPLSEMPTKLAAANAEHQREPSAGSSPYNTADNDYYVDFSDDGMVVEGIEDVALFQRMDGAFPDAAENSLSAMSDRTVDSMSRRAHTSGELPSFSSLPLRAV